ncbi:MAG TPA: DUF748 domain-containing protein [Candidatus Binataceae bacterium]|nr:DUF748 domain-containing protein [Candidatus Binataceae bacterium]
MKIWPRPWLLRVTLAVSLLLLVYGVGGYFAIPAAVQHLAEHQGAAALHRPVTIRNIKFNPFTLRLALTGLEIGGRERSEHFVQIDYLKLRLSWTSILHLALVAKQLTIERPTIRIARVGPQTFNFSDLLGVLEQRESKPSSLYFAISNIEISDGLVVFEDQVLKKIHRVEHIRLAIPFIANLPTDADIYVQPNLQMVVDGCPISLNGKTKPFGSNLESIVEISFEKLDILPFAAYVADKLPFKLKDAELSVALQFNFIETPGHPQLQITGTMGLDDVAINDLHNSPLSNVKQLRATISQFEPLAVKLHFSSIVIDSMWSHIIVNHDGTTNLDPLFALGTQSPSPPLQTIRSSGTPIQRPKVGQPAAPSILMNPMATAPPSVLSQTPASGASSNSTSKAPSFLLAIDSLEANHSALDITDRTGDPPIEFSLNAIQFGMNDFATVGRTSPPYTFSANVKTGGRMIGDGNIEWLSSQFTGKIKFYNVDLMGLKGLMARVVPAATMSGKFSGQATIRLSLGSHFNFHVEPAHVTVDSVELHSPGQPQSIIGRMHLVCDVDQFDLASHKVVIRDLRGDGLRVTAIVDSHGRLKMHPIVGRQRQVSQQSPQTTDNGPSPWQYRTESLMLENAEATIRTDTSAPPFSFTITPMSVHVNGLSSKPGEPFAVAVQGDTPRGGTIKITGHAILSPFRSRVHISMDRIDLASLEPFIVSVFPGSRVNAKITSATLRMNGDVEAGYAQGSLAETYRGGAVLSNVQILDKLSGAGLLRWHRLNLNRLVMRYGSVKPSVQVTGVELSDFTTRLVLNEDGELNFSNIVSSPERSSVPARPTTSPESAPAAFPADITIGSFTFQNGQVNYVDHFIKPNYSAVVTQLDGKIGSFGTNSTEPAAVTLSGRVNGTSPISIGGSINPLAPMASLDIHADATRIQLPPLSPYAAKYTGYPITGGTLSGNVHYVLAKRKLSATNHLILDQLTFGDHVENSSAGNLPVRLAVAVLKDPDGRIDLKIPVSGSLADPDFDVGRIIWKGVLNVIEKAAAAPFTILASAIGGKKKNLSYVEFNPGSSTLTDSERNKLATLGTLLQKRPWLKLQITGRVDPKVDRDGLRQAMLEDEIKRRKAEDEHMSIPAGGLGQVEVTPDEYKKYLRRVYKAADFAKPRDALGMVKRLPPDEMKKLLLANIQVTNEDLRHLAEARAETVYQALSAKVPKSRLSLKSPRLNAEGIPEGAEPRVDFSLE